MPSGRPRSPPTAGRTWPRPTTAQPCASTSTALRSPRRRTPGTIASSTNPLQIGGDSIYGQFFAGLIDEVRVYNVALTAAQIQTDMATPVNNGPDTQPPTQPGTLTATAVSGSEVDLAWGASSDNVGVSGYQLERCQGNGCNNFTQIATPTGTSYKDTGLSPSTSYSYRVRASDAHQPEQLLEHRRRHHPHTRHAAADAAGDPDRERGQRQRDRPWPGAPPATTSASAATSSNAARAAAATTSPRSPPPPARATKTRLSPSTSYSYRVRATDATGNLSTYSNIAGASTPAAPTGLVAAYGV